MVSQESNLDVLDADVSLTNLIAGESSQFDHDMVPLELNQSNSHHESEATSSDSSSAPRKPSIPKSKAKKARKAAHQTQASKPSLRPAKDILSRIRHDPAIDQSEYIVGYHDRHADVMEMEVSAWKGGGDVTDEEWIPQHRILYFRKRADEDGRRIWDRAARLDRLFGSGVNADFGECQGDEERHQKGDAVDGQDEAAVDEHADADGDREVERLASEHW